jgi:uncharacterized membrane protein
LVKQLWDRTEPYRGILGLLLLLAIQLPLRLKRAANPLSIWCDEIYSLELIQWPFGDIVHFTALDSHPPLYYFALKCWMEFTKVIGLEQCIFIARLPSIFVWIILITVSWFVGRSFMGKNMGTVFAWTMAFNAQLAFIARDTRNYIFTTGLLFLSFILLLIAHQLSRQEKTKWDKLFIIWAGYATFSSLALWMHMLSSLVMLPMGLLWIYLCLYKKPVSKKFVLGGFAAHTFAAISILPWISNVHHHVENIRATNVEWVTPPTLENLASVFFFWYPAGRQFGAMAGSWCSHDTIFAALVPMTLLPLIIGICALYFHRRKESVNKMVLFATAGTFVAVFYVTSTWFITIMDWVHIFHAPRYPVLTLPIWFFSLCCWVQVAVKRWGLKPWWPWLIFIPTILMSIHGEKIMYHFEKQGYTMDSEIKAKTHQIRGKTAYYSPSNMTIYLESTFSNLTLRPLTDIALLDDPPEELIIVRDNNWRSLQAPTDRLVEAMLSNNLLSKKSEWIKIARETDPIYSIYVLNEIDEAQFNRLKQASYQISQQRQVP